MDADSALHRARTAPAPTLRPLGDVCSDAELYDVLFHYHRLHDMLLRCRPFDDETQGLVEHVLGTLTAEAEQRGIPLHRLPA